MKILHVLNAYLPEQIAGTEIYVSALVRILKKKSILSKVIIPNYTKKENEHYFYEGTEVIKYAEPTLANREIITGKIAPKGVQSFLEIIKKEQPDVVHFHELAGSIGIGNFHVEAVNKLGFKSIITFHVAKYSCKTGTLMYMGKEKCNGIIDTIRCSKCWLNYKGEKGLRKTIITQGFTLMNFLQIDTRFLKNELGTALAFPNIIVGLKKELFNLQQNTSKFIVLTQWYKDILIRNGINEKQIALIYQGLPINNKRPAYIKKYSEKLRVIFIGRISHFKGVDIMLSALKLLDKNKIQLDIYGTASDETYLQTCHEIAAEMSNVVWKGSLHPELVIETIQQYDIICIPSAVSEMGPFVLKEAFAAGIPAIASNVYGNAEQITDGINGWLFNFNDIIDLKNKLQLLINDPLLIEKASQHILPVKSFETVADEHEKLYKEIVGAV